MNRQFWLQFLCLGPWAWGMASAADVQLRAFFQPSQIHLGQDTQYVVEISGNFSPFAYQPPSVDGLRFLSSRDMQSMQIVNGHQSVQLTKMFRVRARRTGSFTLPSQSLSIQGKNYELPPATLQVLEGEEEAEDWP